MVCEWVGKGVVVVGVGIKGISSFGKNGVLGDKWRGWTGWSCF